MHQSRQPQLSDILLVSSVSYSSFKLTMFHPLSRLRGGVKE